MKLEINYSGSITEPVTYQEVKDYLRLSNDLEQTMITEMITGAREFAEEYCGRAFVAKTVTQYVSELEKEETEFDLVIGPIDSITSVERIDEEGSATTLTLNSSYWLTGNKYKTIRFAQTFSTGVVTDKSYKAVYTTEADCPTIIKRAIIEIAAEMFQNRSYAPTEFDLLGSQIKMLDKYRKKMFI
jgi:uncharacterized phiE125 gp8 family phage protein